MNARIVNIADIELETWPSRLKPSAEVAERFDIRMGESGDSCDYWDGE